MDIASLPNDPAALKGLIASLTAQHQIELSDKASYIDQLEEQVRLLKAILHLAKSERQAKPTAKEIQYSLFDEAEAVAGGQPEAVGSGEVTVAAHARKKTGRRPIPQEFPRVEVIHDIPEADKVCPCGCQLTRIGEEVSEKLDFIPATIQVIRHIRPKYACRACEGTEDDGPTVKTAPMPPQLIPQGLATPGLLAYVLASKFVDGLPFFRWKRSP